MVSRRHFLTTGVAAGGVLAVPAWLRGPVYAQTSDASRPAVPWGVQSGEVTPSTAVIWSATDRPARMLVEQFGEPADLSAGGTGRGSRVVARTTARSFSASRAERS
jgi:phosphodiesterase/alkaline phosphatase D-like protein